MKIEVELKPEVPGVGADREAESKAGEGGVAVCLGCVADQRGDLIGAVRFEEIADLVP